MLGLSAGACGGKLELQFVGSAPDNTQGGEGNMVSATCGDRKVDKGEECDDGDRADGDGCDGTCAQEAGWTCTGAPSMCVKCGNGNLETGEECDDNNSDNGDGCSSDCKIEGACAAPIPIELKAGKDGLSGSVTSTTSKSDTGQVDAADCGGAVVGAGADRVFQFELKSRADLDVRVGSNFDTVVRLMTTACDVSTEVPGTCADAGAVADEEAIHVDNAAPGIYYVVVDGKTAQQAGSFSVNVDALCPLSGLRIDRVILAEPFRTVLFNSNQECAIDLSRVGIYAQPEAADGPKLPAVTIDPLKRRVLTSESPPPNGTTYQGDIPFASDGYAGAIYLCRGECDTPKGSNVFDAFRWSGDNGKPKNAPLQTVSFDANGAAITDRATMSYYRVATDGVAPNFKSTDFVGAYWAETFEDGTLSGWDGTVSALHYSTSFNAPKDTVGAFALELDRKDNAPPTAWNGPRHVFRDNAGMPVTLHPTYTSIRVRSADKTLNEGWAFWGNDKAETAGWGSFFKENGQIAFGFYKPVGAEQPNFSQVYTAQTWYFLEYNLTAVGADTANVVVSINGTPKMGATEKLDGVRWDITEMVLRSLGPKSQVWYDQIIVR